MPADHTPVYVDVEEGEVFYLAFDLLLARVAIHDGTFDPLEATAAYYPHGSGDENGLAVPEAARLAYLASVRAVLLEAMGICSAEAAAERELALRLGRQAAEEGDLNGAARVDAVGPHRVRQLPLRPGSPSLHRVSIAG